MDLKGMKNLSSSSSPMTAGPNHPPKGLIKAKFMYFSHFFSFLDQTCQIDYNC